MQCDEGADPADRGEGTPETAPSEQKQGFKGLSGRISEKRMEKTYMKLSERLEMVLSFVEPGESAADVRTDHGHVPVELVRRGIVKKAVAMDVRKGPLSRAAENIALAGLSE